MAKAEKAIDSLDALTSRIAQMRKAQAEFATFSQEQVDKIFHAAAIAANKARIPLAKMAVEETGMGIVEDKVIKNHYAAEYIYNKYKDMKTCGVIEDDPSFGYKRIAEPIGIVAAVIPTTNPTSTAIFKTLICLKTRNAIIISPHPRAKACTIEAARIVRDAAVAAGAPEGIIDWIAQPSLELTNELMRSADIILATGGPGMVQAAYSSGKPALGVGPGNTPAIIDSTADVKLAVNSIIHSKTFDNGMICASEQSVTVLADIYDEVKAEFKARGCYFLKGAELDKVRKTVIINGSVNAKIVGQSAHTIAQMAGVEVPEKTKILIGEVTSVEPSEEMAHEKLSPVLGMYKAQTFDEAIAKAERLVADGGYGHTSSLFISTTEKEKMAKHAAAMKTCRILVNPPARRVASATCTTSRPPRPSRWAAAPGAATPSPRTWAPSTCSTSRRSQRGVRTCCGSVLPRRSTSSVAASRSPSTSLAASCTRSARSSSPTSSSSRTASSSPSSRSSTSWASSTPASGTSPLTPRCSARARAPRSSRASSPT